MNIQTVNQDIADLERALKIVTKTKNHMHFNKSKLIFSLCEEIDRLETKVEIQNNYIQTLQS